MVVRAAVALGSEPEREKREGRAVDGEELLNDPEERKERALDASILVRGPVETG